MQPHVLLLGCLAVSAIARSRSQRKPPHRAGNAFTTNTALFFGTTASLASTTTAIAGAAPSDYPLFQTAMQGTKMQAVLPLPDAPPGTPLLVVLYFCELYFKTAGSRLFSWSFNGGAAALPAPYDIVAAGGRKIHRGAADLQRTLPKPARLQHKLRHHA